MIGSIPQYRIHFFRYFNKFNSRKPSSVIWATAVTTTGRVGPAVAEIPKIGKSVYDSKVVVLDQP